MYNKYFTMKRSELKEAIKAEITSVLSEEITEAKFIKFKGDSDDNKMEVEAEREMNTPDGELKVYTVKTDDGVQSYTADQVEVVNEIAPMGPGQTTTLSDFEEEEEVKVNNSKKIKNPVEELFFHADSYKKNMIEMEDVKQAFEEILRDYKDEIIANRSVTFSDIREAEYTDRVGKSRLASNKYKQADEFNKSYDSVAQAAAEKQFDDDVMDKAASKRAKKEPIGKEAERLAQVQKFMRQMQDKGIVGKDKKILDTPKYKEEFAKFKASLKK